MYARISLTLSLLPPNLGYVHRLSLSLNVRRHSFISSLSLVRCSSVKYSLAFSLFDFLKKKTKRGYLTSL
ncbi:hypothetical protein BC827DRAFT_1208783 [Russula dissimulans]|nr:hypothetical protein BC827DRAFT_1208783 [Russula dissimulans]